MAGLGCKDNVELDHCMELCKQYAFKFKINVYNMGLSTSEAVVQLEWWFGGTFPCEWQSCLPHLHMHCSCLLPICTSQSLTIQWHNAAYVLPHNISKFQHPKSTGIYFHLGFFHLETKKCSHLGFGKRKRVFILPYSPAPGNLFTTKQLVALRINLWCQLCVVCSNVHKCCSVATQYVAYSRC